MGSVVRCVCVIEREQNLVLFLFFFSLSSFFFLNKIHTHTLAHVQLTASVRLMYRPTVVKSCSTRSNRYQGSIAACRRRPRHQTADTAGTAGDNANLRGADASPPTTDCIVSEQTSPMPRAGYRQRHHEAVARVMVPERPSWSASGFIVAQPAYKNKYINQNKTVKTS